MVLKGELRNGSRINLTLDLFQMKGQSIFGTGEVPLEAQSKQPELQCKLKGKMLPTSKLYENSLPLGTM